jgi:hypothetical protein
MSQKILQINYTFTNSAAEHKSLVTPFADAIAAVPGLTWKVWLMNEEKHEAGGIYLFRDEESVNAFLGGEIVSGFGKEPTVTNISAKTFDVPEDLSQKTRGPIKEAVAS